MKTRTTALLASMLLASPALAQGTNGAAARPSAAQQATTAQVEALSAEAAERYRAGDFRAALEKFREALALYDTPTIQYNIGRCHEALGEFPAALTAYEATARHPDTDPAVRVQARSRADALNVALAPNGAASNATAVATAPPQPATTPASTRTEARGLNAEASAQRDAGASGAPRAGAYVAGAIGLAAAVTGGIVYGLGDRDATDSGASNADRIDGDRRKDTGVVLIAAGGAVLVASVLALVLVDHEPKAQDTVQVGFSPTADGGFAAIGGVF